MAERTEIARAVSSSIRTATVIERPGPAAAPAGVKRISGLDWANCARRPSIEAGVNAAKVAGSAETPPLTAATAIPAPPMARVAQAQAKAADVNPRRFDVPTLRAMNP